MEKENNRWLEKSLGKHNSFNQINFKNNFKFTQKLIHNSNNITLNLDKHNQVVPELLIKNVNIDSKFNSISVDQDPSNCLRKKRKFGSLSRESIVDKSKFNSVKHKIEELYKQVMEEINSSKTKKQINSNYKLVSSNNNEWRVNFANFLENEKNSVKINSNYMPVSLNYLGSKLLKLQQFWTLLIEYNYKNLLNEYEKLYDIFIEAFLNIIDYDSFKIFFFQFMKKQNKKSLSDFLAKIHNKEILLIEKNFDSFLFCQIEDKINRQRVKSSDRKRPIEFPQKCNFSGGSKKNTILSNSRKVESSGNISKVKDTEENKEILVEDISQTIILEEPKLTEKHNSIEDNTRTIELHNNYEQMYKVHNEITPEKIKVKINNIEELSKKIDLVKHDTIDLDSSQAKFQELSSSVKQPLLNENLENKCMQHEEFSFHSNNCDINEYNHVHEENCELNEGDIPYSEYKVDSSHLALNNIATMNNSKEINNTILDNSICCEFHQLSNNKETINNGSVNDNINAEFNLEKEIEGKPCILRMKKRKYNIMGLYENDFPKDNKGLPLYDKESFSEMCKCCRVTRNSLSKHNFPYLV